MRRVRDCYARPAGFVLPFSCPRCRDEKTKQKQKTFRHHDTNGGGGRRLCVCFFGRFVCVCVAAEVAGCCGLVRMGSPDVGEKCHVNCRCQKREKELEEKPSAVYLPLLFFFPSGICKERRHSMWLNCIHRKGLVTP